MLDAPPAPETDGRPAVSLAHAAAPVAFLSAAVVYGLVVRPLAFGRPAVPLEVLFPLAAAFAVGHLRLLGFRWAEIQASIVQRMGRGVPGFFILFAIGMLIGSWIVCGTIPMLVHWGLSWIEARWIYLLAFLVPAAFSTVTGTSWGSAGTIGVVLVGVGQSVGADAAVVAGAVAGGSFFGDKLSPLSDTTNMAALAADVELMDHVRSMLWTTLPSAAIAVAVYAAVGLAHPPTGSAATPEAAAFLDGLERMFRFHPVLLLPPAIVLLGAIRRLPTIPVLAAGIATAAVLAVIVQPFGADAVFASLTTGFTPDLAPWAGEVPDGVAALVSRGGLYSMREAVFVAFLVFFYIGALDRIDAMAIVVSRLLRFARSARATVLAALAAAGATNALISNQYATAFIVGDAFRKRFDGLGVPRRVLSRSIEDTGTMIEPIVPWHPTALFLAAALGVPAAAYWKWEILTLANLVVAPALAIAGIGLGRGPTARRARRTPGTIGGRRAEPPAPRSR